MSRSLYSLDRESARKLLTRNGLAKPMPAGPGSPPEEAEGFAQIKVGLPPAALPAPVGRSSQEAGSDPRFVEQEERWLNSQVRIKELEEALVQVAPDDEKLSALKQKNAEMEGQNRLLEDQLDSMAKKMQLAGTETGQLKARLAELDDVKLEADKNQAELEALRQSWQGNEAQSSADLEDLRSQLEAGAQDKTLILRAKAEAETEKKAVAGKLIELDQELSATRAEMGSLQEEILREKSKTAGAEADAEQNSKLRKQFETARNLLTQAADDNTRLEKERIEVKGRLQVEEEKKNALAARIQSLESEKQQVTSKAVELEQALNKAQAELDNTSVGFEKEKSRASSLQLEADQMPGLRKEIESKSDLLEKAVKSGVGLEKEREELLNRVNALVTENEELSKTKELADADRLQFSGKLNEVGKEFLATREEMTRLLGELEREKARKADGWDKEELDQLRQEIELERVILEKSTEEKQLLEKERDDWKSKVPILELELGKAKDALKQAVMAYHEVRSQSASK